MTKPETQWVLVPRAPTKAMTHARGLRQVYLNMNPYGWEQAYKIMLAASPPAPSSAVGDVVREWEAWDSDASVPSAREAIERLRDFAKRMAKTVTAQVKTVEGLERQIEIRKQAAARHQVCSGHSGKQPTDGECIMCFAERHEAVRNRLDAKHELDRWKEETEATVTAQAAEVERLTGEVAKLKQFPSGDFDEEVARLIRCLQLPDFEAEGFTKACTDAANMLESLEWGNVDLRQGLATAEASLETARLEGVNEGLTMAANWHRRQSAVVSEIKNPSSWDQQMDARDRILHEHYAMRISSFCAALPSPTITKDADNA